MSSILEVQGRRPWCLRCRRPASVCLCAHISSLAPRTKFVFLMHPMEVKRIKNGTGRLAHLTLQGSELLVGVDFTQDPRVVELLADPAFDCRLLYPAPAGKAAPVVERVREATPVLFVLDGTWPCAKKMVRLSTNLQALPRVALQVERPSEFAIKHQPDPKCLATIEAVDRTLHTLAAAGLEEYGADDSERLLRPFHAMIAIARKHAADRSGSGYRNSGPFKTQAQRKPGRTVPTTGRNVVFQD